MRKRGIALVRAGGEIIEKGNVNLQTHNYAKKSQKA